MTNQIPIMKSNSNGLQNFYYIDNNLFVFNENENLVTCFTFKMQPTDVSISERVTSAVRYMGLPLVGNRAEKSSFATITVEVAKQKIITDKKKIEKIKARIFAEEI